VGSTSDCFSISGIADKGASRVCNNVALGVHTVPADRAIDSVRVLQEDTGVVGLNAVAAGDGHGAMLIFEECVKRMLIFEEFFMTKCLIRIRHVKNIE